MGGWVGAWNEASWFFFLCEVRNDSFLFSLRGKREGRRRRMQKRSKPQTNNKKKSGVVRFPFLLRWPLLRRRGGRSPTTV